LNCRPNEYILKIESDGEDFPETIPYGRGMGLRILEYRAQAIGAAIEIGRAPAGGTRVVCRCPAQDRHEQPNESGDVL
jgi:signal transduction histidine kinase